MYRCELCGEITRPGQPSFKVVTETRERTYLPPQDPPSGRRGGGKGRRSRRPGTPSDGIGREIVTEKLVCADCAAAFQTDEV
jgi:hypothetical protein